MYFMYVRFVFMHTRRGNQIPLYMVLRHHGISENWTQDLRIVKCSQTLSHLFSPSLLKLYKVPETRIKCLTLGTNSYLQWRTIFKVLLLEGSSKSLPLLIHWSFRCWSLTLPSGPEHRARTAKLPPGTRQIPNPSLKCFKTYFTLKLFNLLSSPPTKGRRERWLIGQGRCGPVRSSSLGTIPVFIVRISAVQPKIPNTNQ